ncbi:glycoside hydrolase [Ascobolus immersus RN42]|uniref:beta-mannosidase n=1 Tax=Ascobolus immersus RN42 TaxID=1160509 RepID=A0A3N4HLD7_ASCIM|nr:glycoside hydrolase [Ascobolus immersus RN42]
MDVVVFPASENANRTHFETTLDTAYLLLDDNQTKLPTTIPTTVHQVLIANELIPDPHRERNERKIQHIHDEDWRFQLEFDVDWDWLSARPGRAVDVVFEGLDTVCEVRMNGMEDVALSTKNMFRSYRLPLHSKGGSWLRRQAQTQTMELLFRSSKRFGDAVLAADGGSRACWNGHPARLYVRKAQYHFGWDWGPSLITTGPWRNIKLEYYTMGRIDNIFVTSQPFDVDGTDVVEVTVHAEINSAEWRIDTGTTHELLVILKGPIWDHRESSFTLLPVEKVGPVQTCRGSIRIPNPERWFPRGYGNQALYSVRVDLVSSYDKTVIHSRSKSFGIRSVELVQDILWPSPLESDVRQTGTSFYFRINGTPVYMAGANWIPADSFLPRTSPEKLREMLQLLVDGNMNMARVWGGGIYETEEFYDLCDELGIMVWQDITLACGNYPAENDQWLLEIEAEVTEQMKRLSSHPSMIIVAGNNEDYQLAEEEIVDYDATDLVIGQDKAACLETGFPSRWLYERRFPELLDSIWGEPLVGGFTSRNAVVNTNSGGPVGGVVYWPGSPWGGLDSTDKCVGDVHQWHVWGGILAPFQSYPQLGGRFISEFGMSSYPSLSTSEKFILPVDSENPAYTNWQHPNIVHHIKAHTWESRFLTYLATTYRFSHVHSLREMTYLTQQLQYDAISTAYRGWRRRWGSSNETRHCGGALVWQFNDVWPAVSWSITSWSDPSIEPNKKHAIPKPAYYAIKEASAPFIVGLERTVISPKGHRVGNIKAAALEMGRTDQCLKGKGVHSVPFIYHERAWVFRLSAWVGVFQLPTPAGVEGMVRVTRFGVSEQGQLTTEILFEKIVTILAGNTTLELGGITVQSATPARDIYHVEFFNLTCGITPQKNTRLAKFTLWPDDIGLLRESCDWVPGLYYEDEPDTDDVGVTVKVKLPVKGLRYEDRWIGDLMPGDSFVLPYECDIAGVGTDHMRDSMNWWHYGDERRQ